MKPILLNILLLFLHVKDKLTIGPGHILYDHAISLQRLNFKIFISHPQLVIFHRIWPFFISSGDIDRHRAIMIDDKITSTQITRFFSVSFRFGNLPPAVQFFLLDIVAALAGKEEKSNDDKQPDRL